jgi:hypothetical protein
MSFGGLLTGASAANRAYGATVPLLLLVVALLFRSTPYSDWPSYISRLRDRIRSGHAKKYSLSVADCPGQFFLWLFLLQKITNTIFLPGYTLDSLSENQLGNGFTAQLNLAGPPCDAYGSDILNLTLQVTYETASRSVCIFLSACGPSHLLDRHQIACQHF